MFIEHLWRLKRHGWLLTNSKMHCCHEDVAYGVQGDSKYEYMRTSDETSSD
jgi:hypothetical protein